MLKSAFSIYTLLVCFVCNMIFIVSISIMGTSLLYFYFPEYSRESSFIIRGSHTPLDIYDTNESYVQYYHEKHDLIPTDLYMKKQAQELDGLVKSSDTEKLTKKRLDEKARQLKEIYAEAKRGIIFQLPLLLIAMFIFIIHWGAYRAYRKHCGCGCGCGCHSCNCSAQPKK